jgi:hypothetical protein
MLTARAKDPFAGGEPLRRIGRAAQDIADLIDQRRIVDQVTAAGISKEGAKRRLEPWPQDKVVGAAALLKP